MLPFIPKSTIGPIILLVLALPSLATAASKVTVQTDPAQAAIYVNDKSQGSLGVTPLTLELEPGVHTIFLELEGYLPHELMVNLTGGTKSLFIQLEPAPTPTAFQVSSPDPDISGAWVSIDGIAVGELPGTFEVTAGRHLVEVNKPGYETYSQWTEVADGEQVDVQLQLRPVAAVPTPAVAPVAAPAVTQATTTTPPAPIPPPVTTTTPASAAVAGDGSTGKLAIAVDPPVDAAVVFVDGQKMGLSPWNGAVSEGHHTVEVKATNHRTETRTIFVAANDSVAETVSLTPLAKLSVECNVEAAEVFIGIDSIGTTPLQNAEFPAGKNTVVVRKPGYDDFKYKVDTQVGEIVSFTAELEHSKASFPSSYLSIKPMIGLGGYIKARAWGNSVPGGEDTGSGDLYANAARFGLGLQFIDHDIEYVGGGVILSMGLAGHEGGMVVVDINPAIRGRLPILIKGKDTLEFFGLFQIGFTLTARWQDAFFDTDAEADLMGWPIFLGWNLGLSGGLQVNVHHNIGIYVEAGWAMHNVFNTADVGDIKIAGLWNEFVLSVGPTLRF